jgi:hypothetical protein
MYDFWYNILTKDSPCNFELGMSDTDSLLFKVTKPTEFWSRIDEHMDYSNYDPTHPKYSLENKAMLGKFKNELGSEKKCLRFVGLRAKCYSLNLLDKNEKLSEKCISKGLGRVAIKNRLNFDQYLTTLYTGKVIRHSFASIKSHKHNLFTVMQRKKALSHFDSKRYLLSCGIHSLSYGHKWIKKYGDKCLTCLK